MRSERPSEVNRDHWRSRGYDLHAYHGFKVGPLPGCNAMYSDGVQCSASIDEHCHCGVGSHTALDSEQQQSSAETA